MIRNHLLCSAMSVNEVDKENDQLTQSSEDALESLTQHSSGDNKEPKVSSIFMSEEYKEQYLRDKKEISFDGMIYEAQGKVQPLVFFRSGAFDVKVGRAENTDIIVPSSTKGKCGVSRFSFRLVRTEQGEYSLISRNTVPFFIRSPRRTLRVAGLDVGEESDPIPLFYDDKICYNHSFLFCMKEIHQFLTKVLE